MRWFKQYEKTNWLEELSLLKMVVVVLTVGVLRFLVAGVRAYDENGRGTWLANRSQIVSRSVWLLQKGHQAPRNSASLLTLLELA